jgi:hypothetical protein
MPRTRRSTPSHPPKRFEKFKFAFRCGIVSSTLLAEESTASPCSPQCFRSPLSHPCPLLHLPSHLWSEARPAVALRRDHAIKEEQCRTARFPPLRGHQLPDHAKPNQRVHERALSPPPLLVPSPSRIGARSRRIRRALAAAVFPGARRRATTREHHPARVLTQQSTRRHGTVHRPQRMPQ